MNLGYSHAEMVVIRADYEGVLILFPMECNGFAFVTTLCLSLKFQLDEQFLSIRKEGFDVI
jgi:hypothetical protein